MEEKERYELFGEFGIIHDTSPNAECMLLNKFQTCEILNKQDKENQQLKQQLHDLPKKIIEDVKNMVLTNQKDKNGWISVDVDLQYLFDEVLDTILKKYGGENESICD